MKEKKYLVLVFAVLLALMGAACASRPETQEAEVMVEEEITSTPSPTEAPPGPKPGAGYSGPLLELDKAESGMFSLTVSADGSMVEQVSLVLMTVECETFSSGMIMQTITGQYPIQDAKLETEISGIAKLDLRFDTQDSVSGQVHVLLDPGTGTVCDVGDVNWLGLLVEESQESPLEPAVPEEPTVIPAPTEMPEEPDTPTPTPTLELAVPAPQVLRTVPPPDSPVVIVNDRVVDKGEQLLVTGELENHTQQTLYSMMVSVNLIDAGGSVLSETETYVGINTCRPGERVPFVQLVDRPGGFAGYQLDAIYSTADTIPEDRLEITEHALSTYLMPHVIGWVKVVGEETVEFASVVAVFYDAEGKVVDTALSYPPAAGSILKPGDERPFSLIPLFGGGFSSYRLLIDHGLLDLPPYPELEIKDVQDQGGQLSGSVVNTTDKAASYAFAWAAFYDPQGKLLDVQTTPVDPFDLAPGASGSFRFFVTPPGYGSYDLFVGYDPPFE